MIVHKVRQKEWKARRVFATTVKSECKWHFRTTPESSFLPGNLQLYRVPLLRGGCCQRLKNKDITKLKIWGQETISAQKSSKGFSMSGNLEEKTEEGDSKEAKFISFGSHCLDPGSSDCYLFPGEPWTHFSKSKVLMAFIKVVAGAEPRAWQVWSPHFPGPEQCWKVSL